MNPPTPTFECPQGGVSGPGPSFIQTATGRHIDVTAPDPAVICAEDIAHGLALTCRFGGQIRRFYSVAEHSVLVYDLLVWQGYDADVALGGLLHDAPEAFLGDVVTPLKWALRQDAAGSPYDAMTAKLDVAVGQRFGVDPELFECAPVKQSDVWALRIEAERLANPEGGEWSWPEGMPNDGQLPTGLPFAGGLDWSAAKALFLSRLADHAGAEALALRPNGASDSR